ncbi:hypothetical protein [Oceanobacillus alkalisoli]|nr:hypothetical protein [Oceanobacillus alkalisoli]
MEKVEYTFLSKDFSVNVIATIELIADDEGWKVAKQELYHEKE